MCHRPVPQTTPIPARRGHGVSRARALANTTRTWLTAAAATSAQESQVPPTSPATVAKKPSCQSVAAGMTPRQAASGSTYMATTSTTAPASARGNVRPGASTSAASVLHGHRRSVRPLFRTTCASPGDAHVQADRSIFAAEAWPAPHLPDRGDVRPGASAAAKGVLRKSGFSNSNSAPAMHHCGRLKEVWQLLTCIQTRSQLWFSLTWTYGSEQLGSADVPALHGSRASKPSRARCGRACRSPSSWCSRT